MEQSADYDAPMSRGPELRSIANSIEPLFPDAADVLRGIAREADDRRVIPPAE